MKYLSLLILLVCNLVFANQNTDMFKSGKVLNSTTYYDSATTTLTNNCMSNRQIVTNGAFTISNSIVFPATPCTEGTRFEIHHNGTGSLPIKDSLGNTLATMSAGDTYYAFYINSSLKVFSSTLAGGTPFDPLNIASNLVPTTNETYDIGTTASRWLTLFTRNITSYTTTTAATGGGATQGRLSIYTRELTAGLAAPTANIWIKSGDNGTSQYTGAVAITTGTNNNTSAASAFSGSLILATGMANTSSGNNTGTIGGILISSGGAPLTTTNQSSTIIPAATASQVSLRAPNYIDSGAELGTRLSDGPLVLTDTTTITITPANCPSGSCTAAAPYVISPLFPTQTLSCLTNSTICQSQIIIELQNTSWSGNNADKYICIAGIQKGATVGQELIIRMRNSAAQQVGGANKPTNMIVGFASQQAPITNCAYAGIAGTSSFKLNHSAPAASSTGGAYPALTGFLPRHQFFVSTADTATSSLFSIGTTRFIYHNALDGWHQQ